MEKKSGLDLCLVHGTWYSPKEDHMSDPVSSLLPLFLSSRLTILFPWSSPIHRVHCLSPAWPLPTKSLDQDKAASLVAHLLTYSSNPYVHFACQCLSDSSSLTTTDPFSVKSPLKAQQDRKNRAENEEYPEKRVREFRTHKEISNETIS